MNKKKIGISIIVAILIFFCFAGTSQAFLFWNNDDKDDDKSDIEETIENDDGGLFEKIIAKMIRWSC